MNRPDYLISTPENVDLHLELAGLGNRIWAAFIDQMVIILLIVSVVIVGAALALMVENMQMLDRDAKTMVYYYLVGILIFACFIITFGYFIYFEGVWRGQTPGKRLTNIRVIEANGQPVNWSSVFIRNLLRVVDSGLMFIGILPMLADKNERRFGDFAAGTLVIRERVQPLSTSTLKLTTQAPAEAFVDIGQLAPDEYQLLLSFLKRREMMSASQRPRLAKELADYYRSRLVAPGEDSPEQFLEKLYLAYVDRAQISSE